MSHAKTYADTVTATNAPEYEALMASVSKSDAQPSGSGIEVRTCVMYAVARVCLHGS